MKRFFVFILFLGCIPAFALMSPTLSAVIEQKDLTELIPVDIVLKEQMDVQTLRAIVHSLPRIQKRVRVAEILQAFSAQSQHVLVQYLKEMEREGKVENIKSLWIHNGVFCRATKDVIQAVHERADVDYVDYDLKPIDMRKPSGAVVPPDKTREIAWGVLQVLAEQVW
ncbi:hypothetical protein KAS45_02755, partial [candidate division WOR-3 bacterium]|nr:hypothetical protein [candidate division WOR-3 bacterium]